MVKARHDRRDLGRHRLAARHAGSLARRHIVGDAADREAAGFQRVERRDHLGAHRAGEDRQNRFAFEVVTQRARFFGEQCVEGRGVDLGALEQRPGIGVGVARIHPAHEIAG